jgi:hypothetical protein
MKSETKNVFISHYGKDDEHVQKLKNLLGNKGYQLRNSSIDSTKPNQASNPDYIKQLLRSRLKWSSTCVVLIGPNTHKRDWVNWEIEQAFKLEKQIIGIFIHGASSSDTPENLDKYGSALVGWDSSNTIKALGGENIWCNPDNSVREGGRYKPQRINC